MRKNKHQVLFEDDHLLIVEKPSGVLSIPDRFDKEIINTLGYFRDSRGELHTVNRLDRETSGIMIMAKNSDILQKMTEMQDAKKISKFYLTITSSPPQKTTIIETCIRESIYKKGTYEVHEKGKLARTKIIEIEDLGGLALVKLQLLTGRTHQIRVHLRHIGTPIICDKLYGFNEEFFLSDFKRRKYRRSKTQEERPLLSRQALHATEVIFTHPISGEKIHINSQVPKDMKAVIHQLRKLKK